MQLKCHVINANTIRASFYFDPLTVLTHPISLFYTTNYEFYVGLDSVDVLAFFAILAFTSQQTKTIAAS